MIDLLAIALHIYGETGNEPKIQNSDLESARVSWSQLGSDKVSYIGFSKGRWVDPSPFLLQKYQKVVRFPFETLR